MELYTFDITRIPNGLGCYCKDPNHYLVRHPILPICGDLCA